MPNILLINKTGEPWKPCQLAIAHLAYQSIDRYSAKDKGDVVFFKTDFSQDFEPQLDQFLSKHHGGYFVVLSNIPTAKEAVLAFSKGARAYLNAYAGPKTYQQVVDVVMSDSIWVGSDMMRQMMVGMKQKKSPSKNLATWQEGLTAREIAVGRLLAQGLNNKLIARELDITERTVKAHIGAIFKKKDVKDRLHLALLLTQ